MITLLIIPIYILVIHNLGSIISSFVSMAWSLASYHRSIRFPQKSKLNISWAGTVLQFLWHILVTGKYIKNYITIINMKVYLFVCSFFQKKDNILWFLQFYLRSICCNLINIKRKEWKKIVFFIFCGNYYPKNHENLIHSTSSHKFSKKLTKIDPKIDVS